MIKTKMFRKTILIPLFLIILWIVLTVLYIFNNHFSTSIISYSLSKNHFNNFSSNKILAGKKVAGEFTARENNLGIVSVSFSTFNKVSYLDEDTLIFSIKEKGSKEWYYQNKYRSGLIYQVPVFPFGFPKISNSMGKTYYFEIESLNGNKFNAIALNNWEPVLITRYQIPKNKLLNNKVYLVEFLLKRVLIAFGDSGVIFFSFIYLLPFIFYLLLYFPPVRKIVNIFVFKCKRKILYLFHLYPPLEKLLIPYMFFKIFVVGNFDLVLLLVVLINIFLVPIVNDVALIVVILLWLYLAKTYKNTSKESFNVGLFFIIVCPVVLIFNLNEIAEKSAIWAFMFLVAGTIQALVELRLSKVDEKN